MIINYYFPFLSFLYFLVLQIFMLTKYNVKYIRSIKSSFVVISNSKILIYSINYFNDINIIRIDIEIFNIFLNINIIMIFWELNIFKSEKRGVCRRTPDRIRTCDLRIRNPLLYPAELPGHAPNLTN